MKKGFLILNLFLLIVFICRSQNGSTLYPFTEPQVRTMAELRIHYEYILDRNNDLTQLIRYCDSIRTVDNRIIKEMTSQIGLQKNLIANKDAEIEQWEGKFGAAEDQIRIEKRKRIIYQVTTGVSFGLAVVLLVIK